MSTIESTDPLEELTRENETASRLVERLADTAIGLRDGGAVTPGEIAEGLRLLAQYRQIHARRFDADLQSEARRVAMPTCFQHLDNVDRDLQEGDQGNARVRSALAAYSRGDPEAQHRLATELDGFTQQQYDAIRYEGDYPLSCLHATLPDSAAERVRKGFDRDASELADLEQHIEHYLARSPGSLGTKLPIRCHQDGCSATAEAQTYPAENGCLGIRAPSGWKGVSRSPRPVRDHTVLVDIDFYCPQHAEIPRSGGVAQRDAPLPPSDGEVGGCSCCDPVPVDLS